MDLAARNRVAADYVAAFAQAGSRALIANLDTRVALHHWGNHALPVTINDGEPGGTFVCSPRVTYGDYILDELDRFPNPAIAPALRLAVRGLGGLLRRADADRIVHINNWMMSTNLPVDLDPSLARDETDGLAAAWPSHLLAMRSLTRRHSAPLIDALTGAGWLMLPSRQVFLVDDVAAQCLPRRDTKRDDKLWRGMDLTYEELTAVDDADAARMAALYGLLYLQKYSRLNPAFTPRFIQRSGELGVLRHLVLRDAEGVIQAFGAMHHMGRHCTMPLLGYDTGADPKRGLYRLAFHAGALYAARRGLQFNMSSGATAFKRHRGATAEMEFTAFYFRHLPPRRRRPFGALHAVAKGLGMPILRRYDL